MERSLEELIVGWVYSIDGRSLNDNEIGFLMMKGILITNPDGISRNNTPYIFSTFGYTKARELGI